MSPQVFFFTNKTMLNKTKILLVEDNPADVQLTQLTVSDLTDSIEVIPFPNGLELLQYMKTNPLQDINLILLDLNMPRMGGIETLQHLNKQEAFQRIPVVIFTSSAHREDIQTCYQLGANAYVNKPVDYDLFIKAIRSILEFWTEVNIHAIENIVKQTRKHIA